MKKDILSVRSKLREKNKCSGIIRCNRESIYTDQSVKHLKAAMIILPVIAVILVGVVIVAAFYSLKDYSDSKGTDPQFAGALTDQSKNDELMVIVSPYHSLPDDYKVNLEDYRGVKVDKRVIGDLDKLISDAEQDGIALRLDSGFISVEDQDEMYQDEVRRLIAREGYGNAKAVEEAEKTVPMGNHADAQTGLSVVFGSLRTIDFTESEEYRWLLNNSYRYGFIQRYPREKENETGISCEPSRFRYIGVDNSIRLRTLDMCLDEYIVYLNAR